MVLFFHLFLFFQFVSICGTGVGVDKLGLAYLIESIWRSSFDLFGCSSYFLRDAEDWLIGI